MLLGIAGDGDADPGSELLAEKADELFASPPDISNLDVIANKL